MISVIIPTYNPNKERLHKVLACLSGQTFPQKDWELIIIDNNSSNQVAGQMDLSWHKQVKLIQEPKQGLTYARCAGIKEAIGNIIIMVDDDNLLESSYLQQVDHIFKQHPKLGAIGGKSLPLFEVTPAPFASSFLPILALRDLGNESIIESFNGKFPKFAPIGAGMSFRTVSIAGYLSKVESADYTLSDRKGKSLSSSGDNDMVMEILKAGWDVGYFPQLQLQHLIPASRTSKAYLAKLNFGIRKSWIQFAVSHDICEWQSIHPVTVPFRKLRSYIKYRAWKSEQAYIHWMGSCGQFEGLALYKNKK